MSVKIKNKQFQVTDTFDFGNNRITNLADPTANSDAVTLSYFNANSGITVVSSLSELTDTTIDTPTTNEVLTYNGSNWVNSGATTIDGFLGTVTKDSVEPSNLKDTQWVMPAPQSDGTFEYTFDNFLDVTSTAIHVNISLENVWLRYNEGGDYWIKESFDKSLSSGKTWIGTTDNKVSEIEIIEEWAPTETLSDIGQKYDLQTQTMMKTSAVKTTIVQNYLYVQNIDLSTVANTKILENVTGKKLLIKNIKLIILNTENSTFTVNVGTNSSSFNNIVNAYDIANVVIDEYYILPLIDIPTGSDGTIIDINSLDLYFRVSATDATTLEAHLLLEGFIY